MGIIEHVNNDSRMQKKKPLNLKCSFCWIHAHAGHVTHSLHATQIVIFFHFSKKWFERTFATVTERHAYIPIMCLISRNRSYLLTRETKSDRTDWMRMDVSTTIISEMNMWWLVWWRPSANPNLEQIISNSIGFGPVATLLPLWYNR